MDAVGPDHDDVGGLAFLQRADPILEMESFRATERRQSKGIADLSAEYDAGPVAVPPIAGCPPRSHLQSQAHLGEHVAGIVGVDVDAERSADAL